MGWYGTDCRYGTAFMRAKGYHMKNGQLKPGYNPQHEVSEERQVAKRDRGA